MGGPCEIRAFSVSETAVVQARAEIQRLERKYSRYLPASVTTQINASAGKGGIRIDNETGDLLRYAEQAWAASSGLFDITSGILRRAWDFREARIPAENELTPLLSLIGWQKLDFRDNRLELPPGMEIDFGGIVKEYAADRAANVLRAYGANHALVEMAGDISVTGPLPDGLPWLIRIRHPRNLEDNSGTMELRNGAVATSGDYERCIVLDGVRYSHILNPLTGWPVSGLASVTVQHATCTAAGTLATIAMLKGVRGAEWLEKQGVNSICIPA